MNYLPLTDGSTIVQKHLCLQDEHPSFADWHLQHTLAQPREGRKGATVASQNKFSPATACAATANVERFMLQM